MPYSNRWGIKRENVIPGSSAKATRSEGQRINWDRLRETWKDVIKNYNIHTTKWEDSLSPGEIKAFEEAQESARVFVESLDLFHPRVVKVRFTAKNRKRYLAQFHSCAKAMANMKDSQGRRIFVNKSISNLERSAKQCPTPKRSGAVKKSR